MEYPEELEQAEAFLRAASHDNEHRAREAAALEAEAPRSPNAAAIREKVNDRRVVLIGLLLRLDERKAARESRPRPEQGDDHAAT